MKFIFSLTILLIALSPEAKSAGLPTAPIRAVALKMASDNQSLDRRALLRQKLSAVTANLGSTNVDLVVVPEYTFYSGYVKDPIRIIADGSFYKVVSIGTLKSDEIVAAVHETTQWAFENNINVILGTVADQVTMADDPTLPKDIVFNTQLIIDNLGRIIGFKRKATEWNTSLDYMYSPMYPWVLPIKQKALQSVRAFALRTQSGADFVVLPVICDERSDVDMLNKASDLNADLIVLSERDGSRAYEDIMAKIQSGITGLDLGESWPIRIRDTFIKNFVVDRNAVKPGGWVISSDSAYTTQGAIIELNVPHKQLPFLIVTNDYVYSHIQFADRPEATSVSPVISAISHSPSAVTYPTQPTLNLTSSDPDNAPLAKNVRWLKIAGAGTATFDTTATTGSTSTTPVGFSAPGPYVLRAQVSDGMTEVIKDYPILIDDPDLSVNKAPAVSAGVAITATYPNTVTLQGVAIDDNRPRAGYLSLQWSSPYNQSAVSFSNTSTAVTTVKPNQKGTFTLRLTASDSALTGTSYVTVTWQ
ncbi:hypothetical protein [Vitiosangium sp. GDMCC 1.1324]|uniref:PKD domain-containing protein n=1 Tax=Vitiosangium sp. (strain GDMCC 1.1324) TaxID=2138576 RepID=UPI0011B562DF|nr:hypothetical protein [Vitiosangium sp. GDMCC 1.1324]